MKRLWIIGVLLLCLAALTACQKDNATAFYPGETPAVITLAPASPEGARLVLKTVPKDGGGVAAESLTVLAPQTLAGTVFRFDEGITASIGQFEIPLEVDAAASIGLLAEAFLLREEAFTEGTEGDFRTLTAEGTTYRITLWMDRDSGLPARVLVETEDARIDAAVISFEKTA